MANEPLLAPEYSSGLIDKMKQWKDSSTIYAKTKHSAGDISSIDSQL